MLTRVLAVAALLAAGCATSGGSLGPSPQGQGPAAKPTASRVPDFFRRAPWATAAGPDGRLVHTHQQARLRFLPRAGELQRTKVTVYDDSGSDVSFYYGGEVTTASSKCMAGLSVYVYPATAPLDRHLEAVRAEIVRANPRVRDGAGVLNLDLEHGGNGVHAAYLNPTDGLEAFEGVSVFERAGWFIKYRTTIGPVRSLACQRRIRTAIAEIQVGNRLPDR